MDIQRILSETAERHPGRTAVISGSRSYTYAELRERVAALARIIRSAGIAPGDRVAILERNTHAFLETYFAAAGAGAILVPLNTRLNRGEQAEILLLLRATRAAHGPRPGRPRAICAPAHTRAHDWGPASSQFSVGPKPSRSLMDHRAKLVVPMTARNPP